MQNLLLILFSPSSFLHNTFPASFLCIFMGINLQAATGIGSGLGSCRSFGTWQLGGGGGDGGGKAKATKPRCVIVSALTDSRRSLGVRELEREPGKSVAGINSTAKPPAGSSGQFQVEKLNIHKAFIREHCGKI